MKYYTGTHPRLSRLPSGLKLILALYLVTTLLGFWMAGLKYLDRDLVAPHDIREYYLGDDSDELLVGSGPKGRQFLTDVTHPHLFSVPLVLLVLGHLVQLCGAPQWLKNTLYVTAFAGLAATFGAPWLLQSAPGLAFLVSAGGTALLLSGTVLCLLPLRELARKRSR